MALRPTRADFRTAVADIIAPTAMITAAMAIIKNKVAITAQLEGRRLSWRPFPLLHSGEAGANDGINSPRPAPFKWSSNGPRVLSSALAPCSTLVNHKGSQFSSSAAGRADTPGFGARA